MKFELEAVLSLKQNIEDVKKRELGLANLKKMQLEEEKEILEETFTTTLGQAKISAQNKVNVEHIKQTHHYTKHLKTQIKDKDCEIIDADKQVEQRRKELTEAVKQRKILENLKTLRLEQFYEEEKKREQNLTDEIVSYQYTKKGKGE